MAPHRPDRRPVPARGLTLLELMISMLMGLSLLAALMQVFVASRAGHTLHEQFARVQENGRLALDMLTRSIRMTAHAGCLSTVDCQDCIDNVVHAAPGHFAYALEHPLEGFDATSAASGDGVYRLPAAAQPATDPALWNPALPPELLGRALPGSDVIALRSLAGSSVSLVAPYTSTQGLGDATLYVTRVSGYQAGQIAAVTDCRQGAVFQISQVDAQRRSVAHFPGGALQPGNRADAAAYGYAPGAELARLESMIFYVGRSGQPGGGPALFLRSLNNAGAMVSEEIVEGIANLQITYGVDENADGTVDVYRTAAELGRADSDGWGRVIAVRLALLAQSVEESGPDRDTRLYRVNDVAMTADGNDGRYRQVFTATIALRNRLP